MKVKLDALERVEINIGDELIFENGTVFIAKEEKRKLSCIGCYFYEKACPESTICMDCILVKEDGE